MQNSNNPGPETLEGIYRKLRLIRRFEEEVARIYPTDVIKSPVHLSIGQEAVSVGVCEALNSDDVVSGTYRGHAAYLAKGGDMNAMMAELYGKATGCARGRGGSMHIVDMDHGVLGTSAVVGTTVSIAVGYALALKREGRGRVIASFFGDGATDEGCFYECLAFAFSHRLPILFICENNFYAIHTHNSTRWPTPDLCQRVASFGLPTRKVTDLDVLKIRENSLEMVRAIRQNGEGPQFMECHCYRWKEHVGPGEDFDAGYRSREELQPWLENDQVSRLGGMLEPGVRSRIDETIEKELAEAIDFAETSPVPEPKELYTHVFAD